MKINKIDVLWNYIATFFKISSSLLLLPLILRKLPSEDVAIWTIFSSIGALVFLIDFGFNSSFSRNVTYIFSGVSTLQKEGHEVAFNSDNKVNYGLLKGLLAAMRWFYSRIALILLLLLGTIGTAYIHRLLAGYHGNAPQICVAWFFFISISTYNLYTLYYDALLEGRGLIRISKQITILGHIIYLGVSVIAIILGAGLVSLVLAQLVSIIIIRALSQRLFFDSEMRGALKDVVEENKSDILKAIYPNALKYGVTSIGGFMIQKSSIFIGSLYLTLPAIASFGVTKQLFDITVNVANISLSTFLPQIANLRVGGNYERIKVIYIKGVMIANAIFVISALIIILLGPKLLSFIKSNTVFDMPVLIVVAISSLIGLNSGVSGAVISTRNHIPFMKPSIYSGFATVLLLFVFFKFTHLGLIGMALAPGLVDLCYQGWKWPLVVAKELHLKFSDFVKVIVSYSK